MTIPSNPSPRGAQPPAPAGALSPAGLRWSIVPHTHWDREWYLPFEVFRMRLARTVDEIVETMEADAAFRAFTLDGQAIVLDDYAEVRPAARVERLHALIRSGRIAVGPWYVLPDEFLEGGEALVRNLLAGREVVRRHGGDPMPVGYLPDPFGHVAQLPQILRGFGIGTFIFWRGLDDRADALGTAFTWQAPDGSEVAAIRQLDGYGNANQLGAWGRGGVDRRDDPAAWPEIAADRFARFVELYEPEIRRGPLRHLLLCNGSDHEPIWPPLPRLLDHVRAAHPGLAVGIATYGEYAASVSDELVDMPVLSGELVGGRDAPVLRGINSTRMWLKQENERTQRALLAAETLASLALLGGGYAYPREELGFAWRELLKNHPHDSISGCSVDEVHRDMAQRFVTAQRIAERVRREALAALAGRTERWSYRPAAERRVSVVNPLPAARTGLVALPVPPELRDAGALGVETDGGAIPAQRDGDRLLVSLAVPGWDALALAISPAADGSADADGDPASVTPEGVIENAFYRIRVEADGSLTVLDRHTGRVHVGLHRLEDVADRGDEYNFDEVPGDVPRSLSAPPEVRVVSRGPVVAELEVSGILQLPVHLRADRAGRSAETTACEVVTRVRLVAGIRRIEIETLVDNRAEDHRLSVVFPTGGEEPVRAEGAFTVVTRTARMAWKGSGWKEPPASTAHTEGAVAAGEISVLARGLPEYEARPAAGGLELAVTLLRCVGWLSRDDLASRPGHAGPGIAVPEAQCPGRHRFEYALVTGELDATTLVAAGADYRTPLEIGPAGADLGAAPRLSGDPIAFSALKQAEDGDGVVLRLFNPGDAPARVAFDRPVTPVHLDEAPAGAELDAAILHPGAIGTFRVRAQSAE